jgi:hypothetical protein
VSLRTEVLLWAQRVNAKKDARAHELLEIDPDGSVDAAQDAFHKIARTAHPDLHRTTLTPEELESVTTAYARIAGAYQEVRSQRMKTTRIRPMKDDPPPVLSAKRPSKPSLAQTPPSGVPVAEASASTSGPTAAAGAMNAKALLYYRKAESCLRRGDLRTAALQMKMAIAGDPQSTFLRSALAEIEAELAKT